MDLDLRQLQQRVEYDDATHTYKLNGVRVESVSAAVRIASPDAFRFVDDEVLARAAKLGQRVHDMIHQDFLGTFDMEDSAHLDLLPYLDAWHDFLRTTGFTIIACEEIVFSERYGYAGRLDIFGQWPDLTFSVVDTKRVATVQRVTGLQTAGYKTALCEMLGINEDAKMQRHALQLTADHKAKLHPFTNPQDRSAFLSAMKVAQWRAAA